MVWPKTYTNTIDLWQEDNELGVQGKVKLRDDQVQLYCDQVRPYQAETAQATEAPPTSQSVEETIAPEEAAEQPAPAANQRLVINLTQTSDAESDIAYLNKVVGILKNCPGTDEVSLQVNNGNKVFTLKLPAVTIRCCPELQQQLIEQMGEEGIKLESC
jgi:DNA polymerase III alpha subunit